MNKKLLIVNNTYVHCEIIESIIVKYHEILKIDKEIPIDIYLNTSDLTPGNNRDFIEYIKNKYPKIKFENTSNYDYFINCTVYDRDFQHLDKKENSTNKYISHEITDRLKTNPNVYYLTPLSEKNYIYADVLPYSNDKKISNIPIYVVQGNLNMNRRNLGLLEKILDQSYQYDFKIKLIGRGYLPGELQKYKNKIILKNNLKFIDYHKEFLDAYCILPLITKETHSSYYNKKLTSSINYARGYKLKSLIDTDLQEIYNLEDVEIFNDMNDISDAFTRTLEQFYNEKNDEVLQNK